ncbi:tripartite tricarboxylate transporter substrate binding protein [Devosia sp. Leaf64]|jgi:tripartite-type tricarboxylate transporter receptor subunit TctC|uniref:Bug family tripartite tricarboxylate transporter substrate binding protein n=1 Tax=Devosia sp. Leaf64 TaxID=1736229 RepID=UPI000713F0AB|nr:tripartite tricarboxylate transporter substrate binding protein [Devosia sp. Leaf64]KQN71504.1 ABC transporter substrate-binding protein [Devosia sp. Leaf64]
MKLAFAVPALVAGTLALVAPVLAQGDFPSHPINLVVPFAAGGSTDLVGRIVAEAMSKELGQNVLVVNQAGAGGVVGATAVVDAAPDGYTILMGTIATHALSASLYATPPFDPSADFTPISLLVTVPNVLLVNPDFPAKTVEELIAKLKAEPEEHAYASSGNGTPLHLSGELFKSMTGTDMVHVPYQGSGPALVDALSGAVPIIFDNLPSASEHMKAGTLRPLAVTTLERSASFPDVPTMDEAGVPGYETNTWNALFAPAGTPPEVIEKLNAAAVAAVNDPAVKEQLAEAGAVVVGSTPEELAEHVKSEVARWAPVIAEAGVSIQ